MRTPLPARGHASLSLRTQNAAVEMPGPGAHDPPPGIGRTRPVPRAGLPRARAFRSAHLRALSNQPLPGSATQAAPVPDAQSGAVQSAEQVPDDQGFQVEPGA